ncbi:phosphotransferase [Paenibacillus sp. BSR1-1]|uniref:phosphotransferase enzyme family protein n=1 Tax=Paenibacillus sp. BSR1-1 TaxID=3020845 RepID=UPI0025B1BD05|nr:phosphotransferase [Paenibacillus sp. BSR1-1]MDN3015945.1 phosphotransferase [Paenibacillus sp. BSR1-1]
MIQNIIAERYNILASELMPISTGFHNSVYSHDHTGNNLVFRISNGTRRSLSGLENELKFVSTFEEYGISVSKPILSKYERMIEEVEYQKQKFYVVAFEKAEGVPVDVTNKKIWNVTLFYNWGKLTGKMHKVSSKLDAKLDRPKWTRNQPDLLRLIPKISSTMIADRYLELLEFLKRYNEDPNLFGLMHNDFHQGNFMVNDGRITVFDFDDCAYHWFAYDLAVSFYHAYWQSTSFVPERTDFSETFWVQFLNGYQTEHPISRHLLEQIPIFLKIREIFLYVLFLEKWDLQHLEDWQTFTLKDLKQRIEDKIPYSTVNFEELIDKFI